MKFHPWMVSLLIASPLLAQPVAQQLNAASTQAQEKFKSGIVQPSELVLKRYRPKYVHPNDLMRILYDMYGRRIVVASEEGGTRGVTNLAELADHLIIYDTPDHVARILGSLEVLDQPAGEGDLDSDAKSMVTTHYTARYVPQTSLLSALSSFGNIQYSAAGPRMISARVVKNRIGEFQAFLGELDQPDPAVRLTCYLLSTAAVENEGSQGPSAPVEVLAGLAEILPDQKFHSIGFSMIQSSVNEDRSIELGIAASDHNRYELRFRPQAFDQSSGDMSVSDCEVRVVQTQASANVPGGGSHGSGIGSMVLLRTDTVLRGNQYTILGASGKDPVFIVIHSKMIK